MYFIIIILVFTGCSLKKVVKHHGVHFLEKKQNNLTINTSNKNDIIELLGPPSTKSTFNKDLLIYIERTTSSSKVLKLGKKTLIKNDVLILEINNKGLLSKKIFFNKEDMNNIEFSKNFTEMSYTNQSFLYDFLSSVRQKMNDPLGKKNK